MGQGRSVDKMLKSEFIQVVKETRLLLKNNSEWQERYAGYAEQISDKVDFINSVRDKFHEWSPLKLYLNITNAKTAKHNVIFELRYLGQTVANLTGSMNKGHKLSTKDYYDNNKSYFDCDICLLDVDWDSEKARRFRAFFKKRGNVPNVNGKKKNEEHRFESLLLTEFSKTKNKALRNIQPVKISKVRFPMPTPISASNHKVVKYGRKGGGIDILTRVGTGGRAIHLCIMELKDKNNKSEPPKDAMKQALAYATFIRELIHSDSGTDWWKMFGFNINIPKPLELYATCVMPSNSNNDYSFRGMELDIDGDVIKLHYLYFTEENNKIKIKPGDTTLADIK